MGGPRRVHLVSPRSEHWEQSSLRTCWEARPFDSASGAALSCFFAEPRQIASSHLLHRSLGPPAPGPILSLGPEKEARSCPRICNWQANGLSTRRTVSPTGDACGGGSTPPSRPRSPCQTAAPFFGSLKPLEGRGNKECINGCRPTHGKEIQNRPTDQDTEDD